jgi:hypothetical protein
MEWTGEHRRPPSQPHRNLLTPAQLHFRIAWHDTSQTCASVLIGGTVQWNPLQLVANRLEATEEIAV